MSSLLTDQLITVIRVCLPSMKVAVCQLMGMKKQSLHRHTVLKEICAKWVKFIDTVHHWCTALLKMHSSEYVLNFFI